MRRVAYISRLCCYSTTVL